MPNPISFTGDTHLEVIAVLANCGSDTDRAKHALVTWIQRKQSKGRSTEHILGKLCQIEHKFIKDPSLHDAFRDARACTDLPRSFELDLPDRIRHRSQYRDLPVIDISQTPYTPTSDYPGSPVSPKTPTPTPSPVLWHSSRYGERRLEPPTECSEELLPCYLPEGSRAVSPSTSYSTSSASPSQSLYRHASARAFYGLNKVVPTLSPILSTRRRATSNPPTAPIGQRSMPPSNRRSAPAVPLPSTPRPAPTQPIPHSPCSSASASLVSLASPVSPAPQRSDDRYLRVSSASMPTPYSSEETITTVIDFGGLVPSDIRLSRHSSFMSAKMVTRSDSPIEGAYANSSQNYSSPGADLPPSYDTPLAHLQSQRLPIGPQLERALKICGNSPVVRREVLKCLCCEPGYETEHWNTRLGDCGLNPDAADFVMLEMCRHLDVVA